MDTKNCLKNYIYDGAKPSHGSIGFVIAFADTGNPIVTCLGQPAGIDPQFYSSEIYSLLATVCLLRFLVEFFDARIHPSKVIKNTFKIYTDSKSMLKKLERMNEYPSALLKMVLTPDWVGLQAVYNELKWFPKQPTIDWIESHQDDNPDIFLSIPVQLNVHVDKLATRGLNCLPPKPHVPLDSSVKIQLNFGGGMVTRNIPYFLLRGTPFTTPPPTM